MTDQFDESYTGNSGAFTIQMNNPGAVMHVPNIEKYYKGVLGRDERVLMGGGHQHNLVRFSTPEHGIAGLIQTLNYNARIRGGTLAAAMKGYSPKEAGNNPETYADAIASEAGIDKNAKWDFGALAPEQQIKVIKAITRMEGGAGADKVYPDEILQRGIELWRGGALASRPTVGRAGETTAVPPVALKTPQGVSGDNRNPLMSPVSADTEEGNITPTIVTPTLPKSLSQQRSEEDEKEWTASRADLDYRINALRNGNYFGVFLGKDGAVMKPAIEENWLPVTVGQYLASVNSLKSFDPNFKFTDESWKAATKDIPVEFHERFTEAYSEAAVQEMRTRIMRELANKKVLQDAGFGGTAASIVAALTDPVGLGISVALPPLGGATRIGAALRAGAAGALATGAVEAALVDTKETDNWQQVLFSTASAFGLSGALRGVTFRNTELGQVLNDITVAHNKVENEIARTLPEQTGLPVRAPAVEARADTRYEEAIRAAMDINDTGRALDKASLREAGFTAKEADSFLARMKRDGLTDDDEVIGLTVNQMKAEAILAKKTLDTHPLPVNSGTPTAASLDDAVAAIRADKVASPSYLQRKFHGLSRTEADAIIEKMERDGLISKPDKAGKRTINEDSVGAARNVAVVDAISESAEDAFANAAMAAPPRGVGVRLRKMLGLAVSPADSNHPIARDTFFKLAPDPVGLKEGINRENAMEWREIIFRQHATQFARDYHGSYTEWAREQGIGWWSRYWSSSGRQEFAEQVAEFRRMQGNVANPSPHIVKANATLTKMFDELLEQAKDPGAVNGVKKAGVRSFDTVNNDPWYTPRFVDFKKLDEMERLIGTTGLKEAITASILADSQNTLDRKLAERYAHFWLKAWKEKGVGMDAGMLRALGGDDMRAIRDVLTREGWQSEDVAKFIKSLSPSDKGGHKHSRRKLLMDENFKHSVKGLHGQTYEFRMQDLFVNDAEFLAMNYLRSMSGSIALARVGIDSEEAFATKLNHIKATAKRVGDNYETGRMGEEIGDLQFLYNSVLGRPLHVDAAGRDMQTTNFAKWVRLLGKYNFTRVMGQVGLAQIPELGTVISSGGLRVALQHMPGLKTFLRDARTGKLADDLAEELETIFGIGNDAFRHHRLKRFDDMFNERNAYAFKNSTLKGTEHVLDHVKDLVTWGSGFNSMTMMLQRWAMKVATQRIINAALDGKGFNAKRMAWLGLDDADMAKIKTLAEKHTTFEQGPLSGRKLVRANLDKWLDEDRETTDKFISALFRQGRRVVQEGDATSTPKWMSQSIWQMMFQFRNFGLTSFSKQLMHGIHMRDAEAFNMFMMSTIMGAVGYVAQAAANFPGKGEDWRDYAEENLSWARIAAAAFQRAGYSTLIPALVDVASPLWQSDPVFAYRTTGLASDITSNPTFDVLNRLSDVGRLGRKFVSGTEEATQSNYRRAIGIIPLQNMYGIRNMLELFGGEGLGLKPARKQTRSTIFD